MTALLARLSSPPGGPTNSALNGGSTSARAMPLRWSSVVLSMPSCVAKTRRSCSRSMQAQATNCGSPPIRRPLNLARPLRLTGPGPRRPPSTGMAGRSHWHQRDRCRVRRLGRRTALADRSTRASAIFRGGFVAVRRRGHRHSPSGQLRTPNGLQRRIGRDRVDSRRGRVLRIADPRRHRGRSPSHISDSGGRDRRIVPGRRAAVAPSLER